MSFLLALALLASAPAPQVQSSPQLVSTGRVVVTVTTLEGAVHMPGVQVELRDAAGAIVIARSVTDGAGEVMFPDVPPGQYVVVASRPGFSTRESTPFAVAVNSTTRVLIDTPLTFELPQVEVRATAPSPTDSVQPVSMSDMLSGSILESAPLLGDDFRSLLPLLPGVVRGADGRLRLKGGQPVQSALQISSASLNDPSTGDFDLDLPAQSVQSVEVLANPFAAEYGRFSASVTQIRTRRGTNDWRVSTGNLIPRIRGLFKGIRGFEPLLSVRGPLRVDRLFVAADVQFRYVATPVRSLPGEPEVTLRSFDSFTRLDAVVSPRHTIGGAVILFPRGVRRASMDTFRPEGTTADLDQNGWAVGVVDRVALARGVVVESTLAIRRFEIDVNAVTDAPMVFAPDAQGGGFFNDQEREVTSVQWVEALSLSHDFAGGQHVLKFGADLQRSSYLGESASRPVEIRRLDGTLAELIEFGRPTVQQVTGTELAVFAQDRWRVSPRVTLEFGVRFDRDPVVERLSTSPRAGIAIGVLPEGRGILRGGAGKFVQRTPLNVDAFASFEPRVISRFDGAGAALGPAVLLVNRPDAASLRTPEAYVGSVEWDQRFGRRVLFKVGFLARRGTHEHILEPEPALGQLRLSSEGTSRYRELEVTTRYLGGERRDLTLSYVWSRGTADLNAYDRFYGSLRHPIVRPNEHSLIPTDVPHRLLLRGTIGVPGAWDISPVLELRSGFPWSPVDEFQDFVGERQSGRLPAVRTLDLSIVRQWRVWKYRFRAGVKLYNVLGASAARDVQTNVTSPQFGQAFNPIERSVAFVFGSAR
jgi:hypothetical protein